MDDKNSNLSFSLLSLLLLIALFAASIALYLANQKIQVANKQYDDLLKTTDHMDIADASLLNYRRLPQPAPMVFQYQIAVPRDTTMELKVIAGPQSDMAPRCRMDLQGPKDGSSIPEQYKVTVYIQNTTAGCHVGCESSADGGPCSLSTIGRLEWLDDLAKSNILHLTPTFKSPVQTSDPTKTITLHYQSESSATSLGLVQNKEDPNILLIAVGPIAP